LELGTVALSSGEDDSEDFTYESSDNDNTMSAVITDATNKNEHIHNHVVWKSGTNTINVAQAFVLQTAEHT